MTKEELKTQVTNLLPAAEFDENGEWLNVTVASADWKNFAQQIRHSPELHVDYLFCLTCVDWKTHLTMVYHFSSSTARENNLVVKIKLNRENPEIETVCDIWRTAEFHEREVFEMFGVNFLHHPDLRKLILPDDWQGYPLRKDYEDPINMIKL
jgi:NADH:ubiquinone oxidoreductase subunit C